MKSKRLRKEWWYIIALVIIILMLMIVFREEIGLGPWTEPEASKKVDPRLKKYFESFNGERGSLEEKILQITENTKEVEG